MKFKEEDRELFKDVAFLVKATYNEMHLLWETFAYKIDRDSIYVKDWQQESMGQSITIGLINKRPIVVAIFYASLNGKRVAFYEGCSELVDHKMIEDWLKYFTFDTIRWDNGHRWANCDATNFHHCLNAIGATDRYPW